MTKPKTAAAAAFKRSRKSPTVTPLTRQLMTKSIHRAILEYQHTQSVCGLSPKSPLDLRVRTAIYRGRGGTPVKCLMETEQRLDKSLKIDANGQSVTTTTTITTTITNKQEQSARQPSTLETVYEQDKDPHADTHDNNEHAISEMGANDNVANGPSTSDAIAVTPILLSRRKSMETFDGADSEIWYTPKEFVQTNLIENIEVKLGDGIHSRRFANDFDLLLENVDFYTESIEKTSHRPTS